MKFLEEIKAHSSKWIKTKSTELHNFYWQDGYGAFSVSPTHVDAVKTYIAGQHAHHGETTYQDELRHLFEKNHVEFDERYVWD